MSAGSTLFTNESVSSSRIIYTPSPFARTSLLFLQETGALQAKRPHVSSRQNLQSYLFFVVLDGSGWLEYNGQHYELSKGSAVFIDCRKGYSQSSSESLWHLSWCHWSGNNVCFIDCRKGYAQSSSDELWQISWAHWSGASMSAIWNKYCERGGKRVFHPEDPEPFISLLDSLYTTASSEDFVRDIHINEHLTKLVLSLLMEQTVYDENFGKLETDVGNKGGCHAEPVMNPVQRLVVSSTAVLA